MMSSSHTLRLTREPTLLVILRQENAGYTYIEYYLNEIYKLCVKRFPYFFHTISKYFSILLIF